MGDGDIFVNGVPYDDVKLCYLGNNPDLSKSKIDDEQETGVVENVVVVAPEEEDDKSNDKKEIKGEGDSSDNVAAMDSSAPVSRTSSLAFGAAATVIALGAIML